MIAFILAWWWWWRRKPAHLELDWAAGCTTIWVASHSTERFNCLWSACVSRSSTFQRSKEVALPFPALISAAVLRLPGVDLASAPA